MNANGEKQHPNGHRFVQFLASSTRRALAWILSHYEHHITAFHVHEVSVAQHIIEIVQQHLPQDAGCGVRSVTVRIGEMAGVIPESLEFCFTALTSGTPMDGATLLIRREPLTGSCSSCGTISHISLESFHCPACGSSGITITSGTELRVAEIETTDPVEPVT